MSFLFDRDNPGQPLVVGGKTIRHDIYVHPDGGMVKIKPDGDPQNPIPRRRIPNAIKCVQLNIGPDTSFANEAFRVDNKGNPLPKTPLQMNNPHPVGTREAEARINAITDQVVTSLKHE